MAFDFLILTKRSLDDSKTKILNILKEEFIREGGKPEDFLKEDGEK